MVADSYIQGLLSALELAPFVEIPANLIPQIDEIHLALLLEGAEVQIDRNKIVNVFN